MPCETPFAFSLSSLAILFLAGCEAAPSKPAQPDLYAQDQCGGRPNWSAQGTEDDEFRFFNRVRIMTTEEQWNGVKVDRATLGRYLERVKALQPQPVTILMPASQASCADVLAVRSLMEARLHCSTEKACTEYTEKQWEETHPSNPW